MSMKEFIGIHIGSMFDAKGFKQADTATAKLNKAVRNLNLGYTLTAASAAAFAKASVSAFVADEASATQLSNAVKNLGMEFANPYITNYISQMEKMSKVADDDLRPAFQSLLQQTGSIAKSQSILSTAIEVSRGSSTSLSEVVYDLNQAYVGNTKGLKKYYLGLNQAALKAASFTDIQKIMNDQFSGSSAAYLSTYSGQVGVLSLAWGNFQETVGGALLSMASFGSGGQSQGLSNLATILEKIGSAVTLISKGWNSVTGLLNVTGKNGILSKFSPVPLGGGTPEAANPTSLDKYAKILAQIEADRKKQNAALIASNKKLTAEQKKQAALKKASTIFDIEQINLIAALKGKLSDEDRKRAELQLAILTDNATEAQKLTYELAKSQGLTDALAKTLASLPAAQNPFVAWKGYLDEVELQAKRIAAMGGGVNAKTWTPTDTTGLAPAVAATVQGIDQATLDALSAADEAQKTIDAINQYLAGYNSSSTGQIVNKIEVTLDGKVIAESVQNQANSGNNTGFSRLGDWRTL